MTHTPPCPPRGGAAHPVRYTAAGPGRASAELLEGYRRMLMSERVTSLARRIGEAAEGLTYPSETDAPLEPFRMTGLAGPTVGAPELLAFLALPPDTPVCELSLDEFLAPAVEEQDWYGPEEAAQAARFRALGALLREALEDIRVYRVGGASADVYVVGRTRSGALAGIKTQVVET